MSRLALTMPRRIDFTGIAIVLGALLLAAFLGLVNSYLPWQFSILLTLLPAVLAISVARPQIGLLVVVMFIFEVVPSRFQLQLPFGGGRLQTTDLLLLYLAAVVGLRSLTAQRGPLQAMGPIRWPLYYLAVCVAVSLVYVRYFAPNTLALGEARVNIGWMIVPLMVLSADTPRRAVWALRAVCGMALVIALYVSVQSLFELRIMTGVGLVSSLDNSVNSDIVRSIAGGGIYLVIFSLFLIINRLLQRRLSWLLGAPMAFLLISGIAVQFGRGVWVATALGLLLSAALFRGVAGVLRVAVVGAFALALVLSAAAVFKPRLAEALVDRAAGIGTEIESGGSFNWRKLENSAALSRIERSPLLGVGIGGQYKQTSSSAGHFAIESTYIHNGYMFFPLKMGLFAMFIPLAFIIAFWVTLKQAATRHAANADSGLMAALAGAFLVPVITSYTQPEWSDARGIAAFAIFMGMALLYREFGDFSRPALAKAPIGTRKAHPR